jgi:hypothetical protein
VINVSEYGKKSATFLQYIFYIPPLKTNSPPCVLKTQIYAPHSTARWDTVNIENTQAIKALLLPSIKNNVFSHNEQCMQTYQGS